ncbi:MAG: amino acid permease [Epulopiscium sp. Nele67-Bin004]|nr:MAG: amino acid permease [Epulopiscium sp. Nele67-Bin004]
MKKNEYSLFTAIAMIVGIVIGSGIFFRSDNILVATDGSVALGVLVFVLAAISIIFGSLSISELAARSNRSGGVIGYAEDSSKPVACAFGWFQIFLYFPTLVAIVAWVAGIYTCMLFGIESTLEIQVLIGFCYMVAIFALNILSAKLGGYAQNVSTIIKLIPLIIIAVAGLMYGDPSTFVLSDVTHMKSTSWLAAIAPIAFSFDGWIVATSIGAEIKDSKKNLPRALVIGPIFILIIYVLYFVGISALVGPAEIMALGDEHVNVAAISLFGESGAKVILTFVVISVLGTVNGLVLGGIRLPQSLAARNMFPMAEKVAAIDPKLGVSKYSALVFFVVSTFWLIMHYITMGSNLLPNSDISEISVCISYATYIYLYVQVIKLKQRGEITSVIKGYVNPIIATLGSLVILSGSVGSSLFILHAVICISIGVSAVMFYNKNNA